MHIPINWLGEYVELPQGVTGEQVAAAVEILHTAFVVQDDVIDGDQILNPGGLRMEREFVRHKALDAIGDLYVLGAPLLGRYDGYKAGHAVNNKLVRALLDLDADPGAINAVLHGDFPHGDGLRVPTPARLVALQAYVETLQR